jgi:hypothetical protein
MFFRRLCLQVQEGLGDVQEACPVAVRSWFLSPAWIDDADFRRIGVNRICSEPRYRIIPYVY